MGFASAFIQSDSKTFAWSRSPHELPREHNGLMGWPDRWASSPMCKASTWTR
jgi:hypothetical protein